MESAELLTISRELKPWIVAVRRQLHMNPELGLEERETADSIEQWLHEMGIESWRKNTAVIGLIRGTKPGKTVALRADMDALPIQEGGHEAYRSKKAGLMHACGHDAHVAIQLGAAKVLQGARGRLQGNVKLLFQPAEETDGGALTMIGDGCLEDPHVDRVYGLHVMPSLPVGSLELKKGVLMGASTTLDIRISGRSAHGAYPETGIDAVMIAANVVLSLHALVGRYVSPLEEVVLTVGTIHGGVTSNILADLVEMKATLRTTSDAVRDGFLARIRLLVEDLPRAFGGSGELAVRHGYQSLVNHDQAVDAIEATGRELLGPDRITWKGKPSLGVEDFSYFIKARPGAFYHLGCGNEATGVTAPLHSSQFDIDEDCLVIGTAMQAALAMRFLNEGGQE